MRTHIHRHFSKYLVVTVVAVSVLVFFGVFLAYRTPQLTQATHPDGGPHMGKDLDMQNNRIISSGNIGIGTPNPQSKLQVDNGYIQYDLTPGEPPAADCDVAGERGRMIIDNVAGLVYFCADTGWLSIAGVVPPPLPPPSIVFSFTGAVQTWTVPPGITSVTIDAYGARGQINVPGKGGRTKGTISVTPGEILYVYVGSDTWGNLFNTGCVTTPNYVCGGGGASDVRRGGIALSNRVIVAGGGGGGGGGGVGALGGAGGGLTGTSGQAGGNGSTGGTGGTSSAGGVGGSAGPGCLSGLSGALGSGGLGGGCSGGHVGTGGGGGYLGGGGGGGGTTLDPTKSSSGGGGGSGFAIPSATNVLMETGVVDGGGNKVIITW